MLPKPIFRVDVFNHPAGCALGHRRRAKASLIAPAPLASLGVCVSFLMMAARASVFPKITSQCVIICLMNSAQPPIWKLNSSIINYKITHYVVVSPWNRCALTKTCRRTDDVCVSFEMGFPHPHLPQKTHMCAYVSACHVWTMSTPTTLALRRDTLSLNHERWRERVTY